MVKYANLRSRIVKALRKDRKKRRSVSVCTRVRCSSIQFAARYLGVHLNQPTHSDQFVLTSECIFSHAAEKGPRHREKEIREIITANRFDNWFD